MAGKKRPKAPLDFRNPQLADALQTQDMAALAFALRHGPTVVPLMRPGQRDDPFLQHRVLPHVLVGALTRFLASPGVLWAHLFLVLCVYFTWFWTHGGQTLAMKTWRIRLVAADGGAVSPGQAILRFVLCWPSLLLAGVGLLWALVDRDRQFLHDRLAGTRLTLS